MTHGDYADDFGGLVLPDKFWTLETGHAQNLNALKDQSAVPRPSPLWRQDSATHLSGNSDDQGSGTFQCDADEILAQAQGISLGYLMDDFINLDDYAS